MDQELLIRSNVAASDFARSSPVPSSAGHWLNVVSHLDPRYGGLSAVVPQLGSLISRTGLFSVGLAAFCAPGELYAPVNHSSLQISYWPAGRSTWLRNRSLRARFRAEIVRADAVHIHGLWEQSTAIAGHTARAVRKPYVLSAHGMLEPWALSKKRLKKKIYSALFERANVEGAACLHALTMAEAEDYRRFGGRGPIAIIPNGVSIPDSISPELFLSQYPLLRQKRVILFLGRLHHKKGLDILLEAWNALAGKWPDAHLVLAGPDFEGTKASLDARIAELGITQHITFTGMLRNELKWSALAASECFVLPSYSEGLSVSVLEAMGVGLPVIVSEQCNVPEVRSLDAGWVIQSKVSELTSTLSELLRNSRETNQSIGSRGSQLIAERYSWSTVARQMTDLYRWVLDGGPAPASINLQVNS